MEEKNVNLSDIKFPVITEIEPDEIKKTGRKEGLRLSSYKNRK